ncbi:MAG: alcohol dehydrogenase catalytic domain-containing protein, partial [Microbacteriaceae bacterium]|nr:alcohol dehydrogenase catalytic domain-containing protein [Microbacteriaceae bacterium]
MGPDRALERIAVTELVLREGEALVAVELATVCGSDLHTAAGHRKVAVPQVLGHEQVGRVVALGPGLPALAVDGSALAVGDRIVWAVTIGCGSCRMCLRGLSNKCEHLAKYGHEQTRRGWELNGGIATHVHLLARTAIVKVGEELPAEVLAPASCATATVAAVLAAAEQVQPIDGEVVVVSGCGMLGLTAVAMATEAGARVVALDPSPARRALAWDFGADAVAAPAAETVREAV